MPTPAWPIRPNWRDPIVQTYQYLTQILTSTSGYEQRIAMRQTPRRTTQFLVTAADDRYRAVSIQLQAHQSGLTVIAEYSRSEKTASESMEGEYSFQLSSGSPPAWFASGALVVIWDAVTDRAETRTASHYIGDRAYFIEANTGDPWTAGSKLCPGMLARLSPSVSMTQVLPKLLEGSLTFLGEPGSDPESNFPAAPVTWDGREVFLPQPNWATGQEVEFTQIQDQVDYGVGPWATYFPHAFNDKVRTADYLAIGRQQAQDILDLFGRSRGRRGEFFVPTGFPDLLPVGQLEGGGASIRVNGTEVFYAYSTDTIRKAVCVRLKTGERLYRKVTSINKNLSETQTFITVDEPWPTSIPATAIAAISWMPLTRFASDELTFEWITDTLARVRLSFQELEYRPQE